MKKEKKHNPPALIIKNLNICDGGGGLSPRQAYHGIKPNTNVVHNLLNTLHLLRERKKLTPLKMLNERLTSL